MNLRHCERCGAIESALIQLTTNARIVGGAVLNGPLVCRNERACTQRRLAQKPATFEERHNAVIAQRQLRLVR